MAPSRGLVFAPDVTKSKTPVTAAALVIFFFLVTVLTVAGFTVDWRPPVASKHGSGVDAVINYLLITTGAIFVIGHGVLGWFTWRFSRGDGDGYRPVSPKVEWLSALIPVLVMAVVSEVGVLFMGLPIWEELYGEPPEDAVKVEVVGTQFVWLVRYPGKDRRFGRTLPELVNGADNPVGLDEKDPAATDDIVVRGNLHLPVRRTALVQLRSLDVLHSFGVPEFRLKQDVIPGFTAHAQFQPTKTGKYEIACSELCGLGHYQMGGAVLVQSREEFEQWLAQQVGWFEY
jgi:cytochrome c oxidase subunit 2